MEKSAAERRQFPRFNLLVDVTFTRTEGGKEKLTMTRNISKGGVCLILYEEVKEDDILDLSVFLPEDRSIKVKGRVCWVKDFSIGEDRVKRFDAGIEFLDVDDETLAVLNNYLFVHNIQ